jgi:hypothetical protein
MSLVEELNNKFLDVLLFVIIMGGFIFVLSANNNELKKPLAKATNTLTGTPTAAAILMSKRQLDAQIMNFNKALEFNINRLDGKIDDKSYAGQYGYRNGDLGPVVNFHQKFRLNKLVHAKDEVVVSDLNNRRNLYSEILANKASESAIKELGWRNWWLRKKTKFDVNDNKNFDNIPTREYLNNLENTQNIYLEKK